MTSGLRMNEVIQVEWEVIDCITFNDFMLHSDRRRDSKLFPQPLFWRGFFFYCGRKDIRNMDWEIPSSTPFMHSALGLRSCCLGERGQNTRLDKGHRTEIL